MRIIFFLSLFFLFACHIEPVQHEVSLDIETMGTWGSVKIVSDSLYSEYDLKNDIDSLLFDVNMGVSTWIDSSVISVANARGTWDNSSEDRYEIHFEKNLIQSFEILSNTEGAFNPFIKPLVDYYNVQGYDDLAEIDSTQVDSIRQCIQATDIHYRDTTGCLKLDFSAIAKGYGVDVVAVYLETIGVENYMVEIGGEVHCKGRNGQGEYWRLGIEEPNEEERTIFAVVSLQDRAMATSGNYRNFKILENGQKIVHIINPNTGYPEISNLLSATIIADDCMSADAYATACMVMGLEDCYAFVDTMPDLDCYLIYSDENGELLTRYTPVFDTILVD